MTCGQLVEIGYGVERELAEGNCETDEDVMKDVASVFPLLDAREPLEHLPRELFEPFLTVNENLVDRGRIARLVLAQQDTKG